MDSQKNELLSVNDDVASKSKLDTQYINKILGENIRFARIHSGMSQNQLANLLGVTFQQIQKYEKGLNRIVVNKLFILAHSLATSVAELLRGISYNGSTYEEKYSFNNYRDNSLFKDEDSLFSYADKDNIIDMKEILMLVRAYRNIKSEKVRSSIYNLIKNLSLDEVYDDLLDSGK